MKKRTYDMIELIAGITWEIAKAIIEKMKGGKKDDTKELQKRNDKAQSLRVIQVDETWFYVESEEGKICYKVCFVNADEVFCTCADFAKGSKTDPAFKCKHLMAVMNCVPNGEFETAEYLGEEETQVDERFITTIEGKDLSTMQDFLILPIRRAWSNWKSKPFSSHRRRPI